MVAVLGVSTIVSSQDNTKDESTKDDSKKEDSKNRKDTGDRRVVVLDFTKFNKLLAGPDNKGNKTPYKYKTNKDKPKGWDDNLIEYDVTQKDMILDRWFVTFNSSSDYPVTRNYSRTKTVKIRSNAKVDPGKEVLGVRIHFPHHRFYAHATIKPFYEIMEYNDEGKITNIGNGVVENVGQVKEISVEVAGRNYQNRLFIRFLNQDRQYMDYFMGYLYFAGWRRLVYTNPEYVSSPDQKKLFRPRLYPREIPYMKFHSFIVSRPEHGVRGDFVVYFKRIEMVRDLASVDGDNLTIDDESNWGIKKYKFLKRQAFLRRENATLQTYRSIQLKKMGRSLDDEDTKKSSENKKDETKDETKKDDSKEDK